MTNAEKIKNMTVDEMVDLFVQKFHRDRVFHCPAYAKCADNDDCVKCFSEWLKEESSTSNKGMQ